MKYIFITYGDSGYEAAKAKICQEAKATGEFDEIIAYGRENLSAELLQSDIVKIKRGGGLWSWKPDVILQTMDRCQEGDIIVYCDAGCTLYPSKEWKEYWEKLEHHDIIAQRIFQRTDHWTRREILDYFNDNGTNWVRCYQYQATAPVFKNTPFTRVFVQEWRDLMINHPVLAMDVTEEERSIQHKGFIENRHDQAIYSALVYKYLSDKETRKKIFIQWEHIEDYDPFRKQAIRATRLRQGQQENRIHRIKGALKRIIKCAVLIPCYISPMQWWYSREY